MPILLLKLLGIGKWLKEALWRVAGIAGRHPWQAALIASLCLAGWLWRGKQSALAERDAARDETAKAITAGQQALAAQIKLHDETKAAYAAKAKEADREHEIELAAASDRTERFIAGNRVRQACGSRASVASAPAEGAVAQSGDGQGLSSELVGVTPADVRLCTANSLRLKAVNEWGQALKAEGLAD